MNQQLILLYLKRHVVTIVGLVAALGFVGYGYTWMGGAKEGVETAETGFQGAVDNRDNLEKGQALGAEGNNKVDNKNVDAAKEEIEIYEGFIKDAQKVIREDSIAPMTSAEFLVYLTSVIEELNQSARDERVNVPSESTNAAAKIKYNFTFRNLRDIPAIARNKIPELQLQIKDLRTICKYPHLAS